MECTLKFTQKVNFDSFKTIETIVEKEISIR